MKNMINFMAANRPCHLTRCGRRIHFLGEDVDVPTSGIARMRPSVILSPVKNTGRRALDEFWFTDQKMEMNSSRVPCLATYEAERVQTQPFKRDLHANAKRTSSPEVPPRTPFYDICGISDKVMCARAQLHKHRATKKYGVLKPNIMEVN